MTGNVTGIISGGLRPMHYNNIYNTGTVYVSSVFVPQLLVSDLALFYSQSAPPQIVRYEHSYRNTFLIFGANDNKWYFSKLSSSIGPSYIQILANSGSYNFTIYTKPRKSNLFVTRFSAPGDSRTLSPGNLDRESMEYSIYNQINFRNLKTRNALNTSWQIPSSFGGIQSGS